MIIIIAKIIISKYFPLFVLVTVLSPEVVSVLKGLVGQVLIVLPAVLVVVEEVDELIVLVAVLGVVDEVDGLIVVAAVLVVVEEVDGLIVVETGEMAEKLQMFICDSKFII